MATKLVSWEDRFLCRMLINILHDSRDMDIMSFDSLSLGKRSNMLARKSRFSWLNLGGNMMMSMWIMSCRFCRNVGIIKCWCLLILIRMWLVPDDVIDTVVSVFGRFWRAFM